MKEATGEVSMTVITIAAIAVIGGILAFFWDDIKDYIGDAFSPSGIQETVDPNPSIGKVTK